MDAQLAAILAAREARMNRRRELAGEVSGCVIAMVLRTPHIYRTSEEFFALFAKMTAAARCTLARSGIRAETADFLNGADGPALLLTSPDGAYTVKSACVEAEEQIPGGRMLDIDVIGPDKKPVNRLAMGYAPRTCLVCGAPAKFCIATRAHTKEELAAEIEKMAKVAEAAL